MIHFIIYADGDDFIKKSERLFIQTENMFDKQTAYRRTDIGVDFFNENEKILNEKRGGGYWLWKPYFILKTLNMVNEGDIVFYSDAGDYIHKDISNFLIRKIEENNGFLLTRSNHRHVIWTKRDCFKLMDCDTNEFHRLNQLEAGCCAFRKEKKTIEFVELWLKWAKRYDVITDVNESENYPGFMDHRHDQSILTNIAQINKIPTVNVGEILKYIKFNI